MAELGSGTGTEYADSGPFYADVWVTLGMIEYEILRSAPGPWTRATDAGDGRNVSSCAFTGTPADIFHIAYNVFKELTGPPRFHGEHIPDIEEILLSALAICLCQAWKAKSPRCEELMEILAQASRFSRWQKLFGTAVQRPYKYGPMSKSEQPPDSVLLVALDVLAGTTLPMLGTVMRGALRLVNNCCQGDDRNRKIVLDNNGVSRIMSLANRRFEPDLVVPALYNLCVDDEIATHQLVHWKAGSPANGAEPNLEDAVWSASPSEGALQVLLSLGDALSYEERKPLLADLLELVSQSVVQDLDRLPVADSSASDVDDGRIHLLTELLRGPGMRLAASDTECRLAVCNTVINLLSHDHYKKSLIAGDLIRSLFGIAYPRPAESLQAKAGLAPDPDSEANLLHCRRGALKTLYSICALPEFFASAYPITTGLVQDCLKSVRESHLASTNSDTESNGRLFPLSASFVILTSLTQSEQTARALIEEEEIHERLPEILRTVDDHDVLYPAISFVGRLALPAPTKNILRESGLFEAMERFFPLDTAPNIQREAIVAVRRLAAQPPQTPDATDHAKNAHHQPTDLAAKIRAPLAAALALFHRTEDRTLKLEIGRLAIETCRTLWRTTSASTNQPTPVEAEAEDQFTATVGKAGPTFAEAISSVVLHGENPGARGEGWFGLALLSGWEAGKELVADCFDGGGGGGGGRGGGEDMSAAVSAVVASGKGPDYENLRVALVNLDALRCKDDAVASETSSRPRSAAVLEDAAKQMGLAQPLPKERSPTKLVSGNRDLERRKTGRRENIGDGV